MFDEMKIQVNKDDKGYRLDVFLAKKIKSLSRSKIKSSIKKGYVLIDGKSSQPKFLLNGNEIIKIFFKKEDSFLHGENLKLDIIFVDQDIIVINKSSGMVMYPGAGHSSGTLINALVYHFPEILIQNVDRPAIVHRLDKETSGVMVCAKNNFSYNALVNSFKKREVVKFYRAFCVGIFNDINFELKTGHKRHNINRKKFTTKLTFPGKNDNSIRFAHSKFKLLNNCHYVSELLVSLLTGRTHQIRAQLSDIGHPILGDYIYGVLKYIKNFKNINMRTAALSINRHALHAQSIGFFHPRTKKYVEFKAKLPDDLKKLQLNLFKAK